MALNRVPPVGCYRGGGSDHGSGPKPQTLGRVEEAPMDGLHGCGRVDINFQWR